MMRQQGSFCISTDYDIVLIINLDYDIKNHFTVSVNLNNQCLKF